MSLKVSLGPWKADDTAANCESCGANFKLFRRRHHCRCCGGIFCSTCSGQTFVIPTYPSLIPQRVCRECHFLLSAREAGRSQQRDRALLQQSCAQSHHADPASVLPSCTPDGSEGGGSVTVQSVRASAVNSGSIGSTFADFIEGTGTEEDSDYVSTAVAGVLSSWNEQEHPSSISFLPLLKENLVRSGEVPLLNVLLFPSPQCYTVSVLMLAKEDTMRDLIQRLAEPYFRLANGPCKKISDAASKDLCSLLNFYSEMQRISPDLAATEVAAQCSNVVLTSLSLGQLEKERDNAAQISSLREFFRQRHVVSVEEAV
ncbi:hypothetical protein ABL78_6718 [Leptomonas seymouri]|uniref:FYVE-type domain-containing protein n=1 Tax=Leptomonas seymouri TaxID=5684 RepID=A0A0N1HUZ5_LEPSE|nr:hypothetical protein ABL78_6718 [Leptomonas seymouri]|eukprot:KPI84232.1 hypothetical protein ABL78_6718 [Leptomonas seymouri]